MRVLGLERGYFPAFHRPETLCFRAFWRLGRAQAKGDCRLGEMNRTEGDMGFRSGCLESVEQPLRGLGRCAGGPAEMSEDLGNHGGIFDACPEPVEGAAMIFKGPPQWGHCSISVANPV
ncbi:MAG: hypothetical protein ACREYE_22590 [Gammaproteobacteria bacterium]